MSARVPSLLGLVLCLALAVSPALAAERGECLSSKLANELMECAHCQAVKQLLNDAAIGGVSMEIHELETGAIVEFEAEGEASVALAHRLVDEIWDTSAHCDSTLSKVCMARYHHLGRCSVELAKTSHGALVVLRGESPDDVKWLRADARNARSFLVAAASR